MGLFDRLKNAISPNDEGNYDDDYGDDEIYSGGVDQNSMPQAPHGGFYGARDPYAENQNPYGGGYSPEAARGAVPNVNISAMGDGASSVEIKIHKPESYDDVKAIADHLLNGKTIMLNLEGTNREISRRLIDFLNGIVYAIDGNLRRAANSMFVITPSNVSISGEQERDQSKQNNQNNFF